MTKFAVIFFTTLAVQAYADVFPKIINTKFETGYTPIGFDTNDNAQLVAEGVFSNTCLKPANVKAVVSHRTKTIHLYPRAYQYDGACLQMEVPWHKEIDLGVLETGDYKVINVTGKTTSDLGVMKVATATNSSPDDFLYAPVSQAFFEKQDDRYFVRLTGEFQTSCLKMREVIVRVQDKVLVLQPIAEEVGDDCENRPHPYTEVVEVKGVNPGRYLIHVRSLNGKAINNLIDVR
jgi:hypothetical protein